MRQFRIVIRVVEVFTYLKLLLFVMKYWACFDLKWIVRHVQKWVAPTSYYVNECWRHGFEKVLGVRYSESIAKVRINKLLVVLDIVSELGRYLLPAQPHFLDSLWLLQLKKLGLQPSILTLVVRYGHGR